MNLTDEEKKALKFFELKKDFNDKEFQQALNLKEKNKYIDAMNGEDSITDIENNYSIAYVSCDNFIEKNTVIKGYLSQTFKNTFKSAFEQKGITSKRPNLTTTDDGFEYYDTTLKKKILWNGTEWTNIDGTAL